MNAKCAPSTQNRVSKFDLIHIVDKSTLSPLFKAFANMVLVKMTDEEANRVVTIFRRAVVSLHDRDISGLLAVLSDIGLNEKTIADIADGITQKQ